MLNLDDFKSYADEFKDLLHITMNHREELKKDLIRTENQIQLLLKGYDSAKKHPEIGKTEGEFLADIEQALEKKLRDRASE